MKKNISRLIYACLALMGLLSSCGEDRSGEYYALIATKTWIYEVMQENYLFTKIFRQKKNWTFSRNLQNFLRRQLLPKTKKTAMYFHT